MNEHQRMCSVCSKLFTPPRPKHGHNICDEDFICSDACLRERNEAPLGVPLYGLYRTPERAIHKFAEAGRTNLTEKIRKRETGK